MDCSDFNGHLQLYSPAIWASTADRVLECIIYIKSTTESVRCLRESSIYAKCHGQRYLSGICWWALIRAPKQIVLILLLAFQWVVAPEPYANIYGPACGALSTTPANTCKLSDFCTISPSASIGAENFDNDPYYFMFNGRFLLMGGGRFPKVQSASYCQSLLEAKAWAVWSIPVQISIIGPARQLGSS